MSDSTTIDPSLGRFMGRPNSKACESLPSNPGAVWKPKVLTAHKSSAFAAYKVPDTVLDFGSAPVAGAPLPSAVQFVPVKAALQGQGRCPSHLSERECRADPLCYVKSRRCVDVCASIVPHSSDPSSCLGAGNCEYTAASGGVPASCRSKTSLKCTVAPGDAGRCSICSGGWCCTDGVSVTALACEFRNGTWHAPTIEEVDSVCKMDLSCAARNLNALCSDSVSATSLSSSFSNSNPLHDLETPISSSGGRLCMAREKPDLNGTFDSSVMPPNLQ